MRASFSNIVTSHQLLVSYI